MSEVENDRDLKKKMILGRNLKKKFKFTYIWVVSVSQYAYNSNTLLF